MKKIYFFTRRLMDFTCLRLQQIVQHNVHSIRIYNTIPYHTIQLSDFGKTDPWRPWDPEQASSECLMLNGLNRWGDSCAWRVIFITTQNGGRFVTIIFSRNKTKNLLSRTQINMFGERIRYHARCSSALGKRTITVKEWKLEIFKKHCLHKLLIFTEYGSFMINESISQCSFQIYPVYPWQAALYDGSCITLLNLWHF